MPAGYILPYGLGYVHIGLNGMDGGWLAECGGMCVQTTTCMTTPFLKAALLSSHFYISFHLCTANSYARKYFDIYNNAFKSNQFPQDL